MNFQTKETLTRLPNTNHNNSACLQNSLLLQSILTQEGFCSPLSILKAILTIRTLSLNTTKIHTKDIKINTIHKIQHYLCTCNSQNLLFLFHKCNSLLEFKLPQQVFINLNQITKTRISSLITINKTII